MLNGRSKAAAKWTVVIVDGYRTTVSVKQMQEGIKACTTKRNGHLRGITDGKPIKDIMTGLANVVQITIASCIAL
jgi:hypothetical protein